MQELGVPAPEGIQNGAPSPGGGGRGEGANPSSLDTTGNNSSGASSEPRNARDTAWRRKVAARLRQLAYPNKRVWSFLNCQKEVRSITCLHCGHDEDRPFTCDLRVCPSCARTRADDLFHRLLPAVQGAQGHGYRLKLVTVTLKRRGIREDLERLQKAIPRFVAKGLKAPGYGVVVGMEVGPSGNVHAHMVYWGPFVSQDRLREVWLQLTEDSHIVDIRVWKGSRGQALREACKYAVKAGQIDPGLAAEVEAALLGKRRIRAYGAFFGLPRQEKPSLECPECGATEWALTELLRRRLRNEGGGHQYRIFHKAI